MNRQAFDPEAVYRVAVQQLKAEQWPESVRRASSTQWFNGAPAELPVYGVHTGDDWSAYYRGITARPSASQPPAQGR